LNINNDDINNDDINKYMILTNIIFKYDINI